MGRRKRRKLWDDFTVDSFKVPIGMIIADDRWLMMALLSSLFTKKKSRFRPSLISLIVIWCLRWKLLCQLCRNLNFHDKLFYIIKAEKLFSFILRTEVDFIRSLANLMTFSYEEKLTGTYYYAKGLRKSAMKVSTSWDRLEICFGIADVTIIGLNVNDEKFSRVNNSRSAICCRIIKKALWQWWIKTSLLLEASRISLSFRNKFQSTECRCRRATRNFKRRNHRHRWAIIGLLIIHETMNFSNKICFKKFRIKLEEAESFSKFV